MKYLLVFFISLYSNVILCQQEYAWVYFKDKKNVEYLVNNPRLILTEHSIFKKQAKGITIDYDDVPVNQDYLQIIQGIDNISILAKSKWLNCIYVEADLDLLNDLFDLSFVDNVVFANKSLNTNKNLNVRNIYDNLFFEKTIDYGSTTNQIEMLSLDFLHDSQYTGNGINMAVIDAGFVNVNSMSSFSRLRDSGKILYTYDFVLNTENIYQYQGNSHGTKVLSTIAGFVQDEYVGTAPDASFYLFRTEDVSSETPVEECYWVEAVEVADSLGVDIINTSLGYKGYDNSNYSHNQLDMNGYTTFITRGANIASKKGILLVNSAGNSSINGIIAPADSQGVLSIGAVDSEGLYASFSSQGSDIQPSIKPDVVAQGYQSKVINIYDQIVSNSGTSFSSPIMAGAIACLMQAYPRLSANEIMNIIRESSSQFNNPDYQLGYGIPNLHTAYEFASNLVLDNFIVYPNPVINYLNIISQWNISNFHIDIFDINGKLTFSKYFTNPRSIINTNMFSKGIYLIKISYSIDGEDKSVLKRIIKK